MNEQRLHDELAIRNLLSRMAHLADSEEDLAEYGTLFAQDGTWSLDPPRSADANETQDRVHFQGREQIVDGARARRRAGRQGPGTNVMHDLSTIAVRFESDTIAHSVAYWRLYGETGSAPRVLGMGEYHDTFTRQNGSWEMLHRVVAPA